MIILDIETSGLTGKMGIWQIGALEFENPENYFLEEARIDDEDEVMEGSLKVIGKTENELRDPHKQSQKQMIENYLNWLGQFKDRLIWGINVGFDVQGIQNKCIKYGLSSQCQKLHGHRGMDISNLAQEKHYQIKGYYLLDNNGTNGMGLSNVLKFCGMTDERIMVDLMGDINKKGKSHGALEDCKLEGECLSRLKFGKNLIPNYSKFQIPKYLLRNP